MRACLLIVVAGCGRLSFTDEPSDAARDGTPPCAYECAVDVLGSTTTCAAPVSVVSQDRLAIDMTGHSELELAARICDPLGWVIHLADSPTCDGGGGDAGTSSNDAEAYFLSNTAYQVVGNDFAPLPEKLLVDQQMVLAASGCSDVLLIVRDQYVELVKPASFVTASQYALRLNPPIDNEGTPDALWYLGINQTYGSVSRTGSGVQSVALCMR